MSPALAGGFFTTSATWEALDNVKVKVLVCDPMDCSLPGSSVRGILQATILELGCHSFSGGNLPDPGIEPESSALQADSLPAEPPGRPQ